MTNVHFKLLLIIVINHWHAHAFINRRANYESNSVAHSFDSHGHFNHEQSARYSQRYDHGKETAENEELEARRKQIGSILLHRTEKNIRGDHSEESEYMQIKDSNRHRNWYQRVSRVYNPNEFRPRFACWHRSQTLRNMNGSFNSNSRWNARVHGFYDSFRPDDKESVSYVQGWPMRHTIHQYNADEMSESLNKGRWSARKWQSENIDAKRKDSANININTLLKANEIRASSNRWKHLNLDAENNNQKEIDINSQLPPDHVNIIYMLKPIRVSSSGINANNLWKIENGQVVSNERLEPVIVDINELEPSPDNRWKPSKLRTEDNQREIFMNKLISLGNGNTVHDDQIPMRIPPAIPINEKYILMPENEETVSAERWEHHTHTDKVLQNIKVDVDHTYKIDEKASFDTFRSNWLKLFTIVQKFGEDQDRLKQYLLRLLEIMKKITINHPELYELFSDSLRKIIIKLVHKLYESKIQEVNMIYGTKPKYPDEPINTDEPQNELIRKICEGVNQNLKDFWKIFYAYYGKHPTGTVNIIDLKKLYMILTIFTQLNKAKQLELPVEKYVDQIIKIISSDIQFLGPTFINTRDFVAPIPWNTHCINCKENKIQDVLNDLIAKDKLPKESGTVMSKIPYYNTNDFSNILDTWQGTHKNPYYNIEYEHGIETITLMPDEIYVSKNEKGVSNLNIINTEIFDSVQNNKKIHSSENSKKIHDILKVKGVAPFLYPPIYLEDKVATNGSPSETNYVKFRPDLETDTIYSTHWSGDNPGKYTSDFKVKTAKPTMYVKPEILMSNLINNFDDHTINTKIISLQKHYPYLGVDEIKSILGIASPEPEDVTMDKNNTNSNQEKIQSHPKELHDLIEIYPYLAKLFGLDTNLPNTLLNNEYTQPDYDNDSLLLEIQNQVFTNDKMVDTNKVHMHVHTKDYNFAPEKRTKTSPIQPILQPTNDFDDQHQYINGHETSNSNQGNQDMEQTSLNEISIESIEYVSLAIILYFKQAMKNLKLDSLLRQINFDVVLKFLINILSVLMKILASKGISLMVLMKVLVDVNDKIFLLKSPVLQNCVRKLILALAEIIALVKKSVKYHVY